MVESSKYEFDISNDSLTRPMLTQWLNQANLSVNIDMDRKLVPVENTGCMIGAYNSIQPWPEV